MDIVADQLYDGRRFRALTVMDQFTRECLVVQADQSIKGEDVVKIMDRLIILHGISKRIQTDNGSEFIELGPAGRALPVLEQSFGQMGV